MHNPQMVDPEFELNREISVLTSKRSKTEEDLKNIGRLEWYGGLYTMLDESGNEVVSQPTRKIRKCLINTAKISRLGKAVERSIILNGIDVPLAYDGPKDKDELFKSGNFTSRLSVGIGGKRVMRVRPQFFPWALTVDGIFVEDAGLKKDEFVRIVELAGTVEGIGDNRVNGYGKFESKVRFQ